MTEDRSQAVSVAQPNGVIERVKQIFFDFIETSVSEDKRT